MAKILITGATGLIGSTLIPLLHSHSIHTLGRTALSNAIPHIPADFATDWDINRLPSDIDTIIHLTQSENFRDFPDKASEVFQVNTVSTLKLLQFGQKAGIKQFIYASSGGVYQNQGQQLTEESPLAPSGDLGFYLSTKLCSEILLESFTQYFDITTLRFFFVYGAKQRRSMLIPRLVDSVKEGKIISLQGERGIQINPIHVSDAAAAIVKTLGMQGTHKINIAGKEILTLRDICQTIGRLLQKNPVFSIEQTQKPINLIADTGKMNEHLWQAQTNFEKGILDLLG